MSVSLYYSWERDIKLSEEELTDINLIVENYNNEYPFKEEAESFTIDVSNSANAEIDGATKLPLTENIEDTIKSLYYWLNCLTEIRRRLSTGDWSLQLDDTEILWDELDGWTMPE